MVLHNEELFPRGEPSAATQETEIDLREPFNKDVA